jgi:hypothetical protein
MRFIAAVTALSVALLLGVSSARAAEVGANDDSAKFAADGGAAMYAEMAALGLRQTVIGVRWVPSQAIVIQDKALLDRAIANAVDAGLRVVVAVYPYPPREIEAGLGSPSLFGSYVAALASLYPEVRAFVIGNEPNQPAFWRPQFGRSGANVSASSFGPYLAAAYDALKGVDPELSVVGIGLSPRGNDKPNAKSNISTSPVRFLRALGAWYRKSGRTLPLMDAFSFHPYPNSATDPLDRGYPWPNVGFVNLERMKQALWDAFHATAQPTTVGGLKLHLDEIGWQVDTSGLPGYQGSENVAVTDELTQAAIYGELIRRAACDPDVAQVSFFGFRDDGLRTGFQAALQRADGTARPAAEAVAEAIAEGAEGCLDVPWEPELDVVDAEVAVGSDGPEITTWIRAGEDARVSVCVRTLQGGRSGDAFMRGLEPLIPRCQKATLAGLRPLELEALAFAGAGGRVEISVELMAEANSTRRTSIVEETILTP